MLVAGVLISSYNKRRCEEIGRLGVPLPSGLLCGGSLRAIGSWRLRWATASEEIRASASRTDLGSYEEMVLSTLASVETVRAGALKYLALVRASVRNVSSLHTVVALAMTGWQRNPSGGCACGVWLSAGTDIVPFPARNRLGVRMRPAWPTSGPSWTYRRNQRRTGPRRGSGEPAPITDRLPRPAGLGPGRTCRGAGRDISSQRPRGAFALESERVRHHHQIATGGSGTTDPAQDLEPPRASGPGTGRPWSRGSGPSLSSVQLLERNLFITAGRAGVASPFTSEGEVLLLPVTSLSNPLGATMFMSSLRRPSPDLSPGRRACSARLTGCASEDELSSVSPGEWQASVVREATLRARWRVRAVRLARAEIGAVKRMVCRHSDKREEADFYTAVIMVTLCFFPYLKHRALGELFSNRTLVLMCFDKTRTRHNQWSTLATPFTCREPAEFAKRLAGRPRKSLPLRGRGGVGRNACRVPPRTEEAAGWGGRLGGGLSSDRDRETRALGGDPSPGRSVHPLL
ncbi:hypothetical protein Q5P01_000522 [Channa striata]|uniref:Uncharacterized protein n=1 Tax=Channa striata TaxID=64152 RepID=A0AA88IIM4_CHASR|nr:hypothetical protein Q5P01_000522 [Channa striata]